MTTTKIAEVLLWTGSYLQSMTKESLKVKLREAYGLDVLTPIAKAEFGTGYSRLSKEQLTTLRTTLMQQREETGLTNTTDLEAGKAVKEINSGMTPEDAALMAWDRLQLKGTLSYQVRRAYAIARAVANSNQVTPEQGARFRNHLKALVRPHKMKLTRDYLARTDRQARYESEAIQVNTEAILKLVRWVKMVDTNDWMSLVGVLSLVTGRRMAEVVRLCSNQSNLKPLDDFHCEWMGQLKLKGEQDTPFIIETLIPTDRVMELVECLKRCGPEGVITPELVNSRWAGRIGARMKPFGLKFSDLRDIYTVTLRDNWDTPSGSGARNKPVYALVQGRWLEVDKFRDVLEYLALNLYPVRVGNTVERYLVFNMEPEALAAMNSLKSI